MSFYFSYALNNSKNSIFYLPFHPCHFILSHHHNNFITYRNGIAFKFFLSLSEITLKALSHYSVKSSEKFHCKRHKIFFVATVLAKASSTTNLLIHFIAYKRQHIHYYDPNRIWWSEQAASKWRTINILQQQQRRLTKRENLFIFCAITKSPLLLSLRQRWWWPCSILRVEYQKGISQWFFFLLIQGYFFLFFMPSSSTSSNYISSRLEAKKKKK